MYVTQQEEEEGQERTVCVTGSVVQLLSLYSDIHMNDFVFGKYSKGKMTQKVSGTFLML